MMTPLSLTPVGWRHPRWVVPVLVVAVAIFLEFIGATTPLRRAGEAVLQPLLTKSSQGVQLATQPYWVFRHSFDNYEAVRDLEERDSSLSAQVSQLEELQQENAQLRQLLSQQPARQPKQQLASILAYSLPTVNVGQRDGVQSGDLVFIAQTLVGRIDQVSPTEATVTLQSSTDAQPLLVRTASGVTGVVKGVGGQLELREIPQDAQVAVGERVVTVGQPQVAAGLLVGQILSVRQAATAGQVAVIDQGVSFYQSTLVQVQEE